MVRYGRFIVLALLALRGWLAGAAEAPSEAPFIVDVWGTSARRPEKRLPQSSVISIIQAHDGYLWLGTLNGLVRFDGNRFTPFDESNTPGLPNNAIVYLFEDSRGWLWVGTDSGGVVLVRDGLVTPLGIGQGSSSSKLMSACEDASGGVWLYLADGQLWRYANGAAVRVDFPSASGCRSVIAEPGGPVWVTMDDTNQVAVGPLSAANQARLPFLQELPAEHKIDFLLASRRQGYWRFADNRIEKWTTNHLDRSLGEYPWLSVPDGTRITSATEDLDGNLIVGVLNAGVYWFNATGQVTRISTAQGLSHAGVLSVCVDREGDLWVGTDGGGLNRFKRRLGEVLSGTAGKVVQSVCEDTNRNLWVGFNGGGIMRWSAGQIRTFGYREGKFTPEDGLFSPNVLSVFADHSGQIWSGTRGPGGLYQFRDEHFQLLTVAGAMGQDVSAIHQDRAGVIWFGTSIGVAGWNGGTWKTFTTREGLSADAVRAIADDANGDLWVGTAGGGLNQISGTNCVVFRKSAEGLPGDNISALLAEADGTLWVGTGSGLARFKGGRWTRYTTRDGLASDSICYLAEDDQGSLWIGSNAGLMRVTKKSLDDFAAGQTTTLVCRTYDEADGLPTSECTSGSQPAAVRTHSGKLWFPTIRGLVGINPAALRQNTNVPPVAIESVLIEGHEQLTNGLRAPLPAQVTVPPAAERLEIQFTSLNLAAPERAVFRYQLEGHEATPTETRNERVARYIKLPPGHYRFHVWAANEDGVWNQTGCSLAVVVLPPFWRTWWFVTLSSLVLLGAIVGVVYWISTQRLQRQLALLRQKEALERERSRIARDLHDQLGANLTRVSLLGELIESDKDEPAEVETHARQISKTAGETSRALDEIVWAANPANDTLEGLVNYVCKYAQEFLTTAGLRCRLDVPAQLPATSIPPDFRHNVFLVAKEAVNNVVKHAQATAVRVQIKLDGGRLLVEVEDDGRGPGGAASAAGRGRNGLRNMTRRMEDVGGSFSITPAPRKGTLVRFAAPLNRS
ncbi:MAG TPA: two-component regulator propeller domain-containing protein [Verrucomicrobiae bacterium]|nr:two-component regulator propeller domain-containing protein [Verrucomicrobiae bacterium]